MAARFRIAGTSPRYFELVDAAGQVVADSRQKLLRITDVLQGTVTFGLRTPPLDLDTTTFIGACHPSATHVFGHFKPTYPNGDNYGGPAANDWYSVGGSYVHIFGASSFAAANLDALVTYSFLISGGGVYVNESVQMNAFTTNTGQQFPWNGMNITYELWCGTFS